MTKDITNQNGKVQKSTLEDELENEFPNKTIGITDSADKKEWIITIDGVAENVPIGKDTSEEPKTTLKVAEHKNEKFSKNTELEDDFGNKIIVPEGFKITNDSPNSATGGIIIEDDIDNKKENQFVWVPVGDNIKKKNNELIQIQLGRYTFDLNSGTPKLIQLASKTDYTKEVCLATYYYEYDTNSTRYPKSKKAKNLGEFISSALDNNGFYIARYEAGIKGANNVDRWWQDETCIINGTTYNKNDLTSDYLVSKQDAIVWNYITEVNAANICQNMYSSINSDLINSYAWDTALVFVQNCGSNSNYSNKRLNGEYSTSGTLTNSDKNDIECNIYDMAGNFSEWSTEIYSWYSYKSVFRGTACVDTWGGAAKRSGNNYDADQFHQGISFRPILYL